MDGILVIDKPAGITSHDVVARVRKILGTRRIGHTGTLDPFATGVLVVVVGKATRLAQFIDKDEKEYEAVVAFGSETETGDVTGMTSVKSEMSEGELRDCLDRIDWDSVLNKFRGAILQTPPMYSAKKIAGKKLYEIAREGGTVTREPIGVNVHELELIERSGTKASIRVVCSSGTYIRTLAEDIGREIGVGAHLEELRRTRAGRFELGEAVTLSELENREDPTEFLKPLAAAIEHLPQITLSAERAEKTRNGLASRVDTRDLPAGSSVRLLDEDSEVIAIGIVDADLNSVKPRIVLI